MPICRASAISLNQPSSLQPILFSMATFKPTLCAFAAFLTAFRNLSFPELKFLGKSPESSFSRGGGLSGGWLFRMPCGSFAASKRSSSSMATSTLAGEMSCVSTVFAADPSRDMPVLVDVLELSGSLIERPAACSILSGSSPFRRALRSALLALFFASALSSAGLHL